MMKKNGEITSQQIVILIIIIVSFAVLLYFLFALNLGEESSKELCRNSVLLRGNSAIPSGSIPLNCERSYECLTADGSCEGITNPDVKAEVKNLDEVYKKLADSMAECWWMFGEGKIAYVGDDLLTENNYCSICSQIYFDESVKTIEGIEEDKISKNGLYEYMSRAQVPGQQKTYLEYLFGDNNLDDIKAKINENPEVGEITFGAINLESENHQLTVMGITSENNRWIVGGVAVAGVVAYFIPGVNVATVAGALFVGSATVAGGFAGNSAEAIFVKGTGVDNIFLSPTIVEANSEQFRALNCEEILTRS
jgi:hypothetical protein